MLLSMTGHGEGRKQSDGLAVVVELRTVNNRYLKLTTRSNFLSAAFEPLVEGVVREQVRRGTVNVNIQVDRKSDPDDYVLDEVVLESYRRQLERVSAKWNDAATIHPQTLLTLPGVVREKAIGEDAVERLWPVVKEALVAGLESLAKSRSDEGHAMGRDLAENIEAISRVVSSIETRAPDVAAGYRSRLLERVNQYVAELGVSITAGDVAREVAMFADRTDISEELVRLKSHLRQFNKLVESDEPAGRKLDFVTQELFREINTVGSKAQDGPIALHVIEAKAAIERIREMVQNVE